MKTGLLGGTFDPPHLGHLILAQEALEKFSLSRICFVPSRIPPHKEATGVTDFRSRLRMVELAVQGNPVFQVADLESKDSPSYTAEMLRRVSSGTGESKPVFIMGMDSLKEIHTWKNPAEVFALAQVVAGTRPGFDHSSVSNDFLDKVEIFEFPGVWISSSELRNRIRYGRSISYLVPEGVESYIRSRGLYGAKKGH